MKKKNKKALGWWQKLNAGDPEKNMEIFNKNMTYNKTSETSSESSEAAMAEAIESIIENPQTNLEALKALELKEKFKNKYLLNKKYGKHAKGTDYKAKNPDNYRDHLQKDLSRTGEDFTELSIGEALKELN